MTAEPSAAFPFESNYVEVQGSEMHYVDVGEGDPVVFLHGNPTSSYLWRNVIPHVRVEARCVAPDLIGMGKSDAPELPYRFEDHYEYLTGFIDALDLDSVTLVVHDWGSGLGFHWARSHPERVDGIAFMEAIYRPFEWGDLPLPLRFGFRLMRAPYVGWGLISVANLFVNGMLPIGVERALSSEEMARYREPFPTVASRKPVRVWPQEVPLGGAPERVARKVAAYHEWLMETETPKLCLYADPGTLIRADDVAHIESSFPNTDMVALGDGIHYVQEDHPQRIGEAIAEWYATGRDH